VVGVLALAGCATTVTGKAMATARMIADNGVLQAPLAEVAGAHRRK
jgi:hypothetical protein